MLYLIHLIFFALYLIVLAGVVLSWVRLGTNNASWVYHPALVLIDNLSDKVCRPFRKLLSMIGIDKMVRPLDLSCIVAIFALQMAENLVLNLLWNIGIR